MDAARPAHNSFVLEPDSRVLAIVVARIGDTLLATPSLRALSKALSSGYLDVLAHSKRACLFENLSFIRKLGVIDKKTALFQHRFSSKHDYDVAFVWSRDRALIAYALRRAKVVVTFDDDGLPANSRLVRICRPLTPIHAVHERMLLVSTVGVNVEDFKLSYEVKSDEKHRVQSWVNSQRLRHPLIGIQPISFPTKPHRNWPPEHFIELLQRIRDRYSNIHFVVLGDATAADIAKRLHEVAPDRTAIASGKFSLRESAALIGELDLYIGVDTGPTHLAGALNVPTVALYHCSYPGRNLMPLQHSSLRIIEHPATASSDAGIDRRMAEISVEAVEKLVCDLIEAGQNR